MFWEVTPPPSQSDIIPKLPCSQPHIFRLSYPEAIGEHADSDFANRCGMMGDFHCLIKS